MAESMLLFMPRSGARAKICYGAVASARAAKEIPTPPPILSIVRCSSRLSQRYAMFSRTWFHCLHRHETTMPFAIAAFIKRPSFHCSFCHSFGTPRHFAFSPPYFIYRIYNAAAYAVATIYDAEDAAVRLSFFVQNMLFTELAP